jgi:hypothetical protein
LKVLTVIMDFRISSDTRCLPTYVASSVSALMRLLDAVRNNFHLCFTKIIRMASSTESLKKRPRPATGPIGQRISDFMGEIYRERIRAGTETSTQPSFKARPTTVQKTRQKPPPLRLPKQIKIQREKGYHTHHIGKCKDGAQFMAFIVATHPATGARALRWYAVVHRFDSGGKHLGTESSFLVVRYLLRT